MNVENLHEGDKIPFVVDGLNILLIKFNKKIHVIENRCGHFGVPLEDGVLDEKSITCPHHLAKFNLSDGQVMNHVVSQCDAIKVYNCKIQDQQIIFY